MAQNIIEITHKVTGYVRKLGEAEFESMMDKGDYLVKDIRSGVPKGDKPTEDWSVSEIRSWLDKNKVEYTGTHNTKAKLLALI
tara:strand:+ start:45 stop:293 length:249 start_codon:yes stop_codon:yes gene_type:complete